MKNWIKHPLVLEGQSVKLIPLERELLPALEIAAKDKRIWEFYPSDCSIKEKFQSTYEEAFVGIENGSQYPFVILYKPLNKIIGSTRYLDIQPKDRKLEIGWTWLQPEYWHTNINFECKLLLLTNAFEMLKTIRVQLKTDSNNIRSRKAIEKIGGIYEGMLRNDRIRDNGTLRSTVYYSILEDEWPQAKTRLLELYNGRQLK